MELTGVEYQAQNSSTNDSKIEKKKIVIVTRDH